MTIFNKIVESQRQFSIVVSTPEVHWKHKNCALSTRESLMEENLSNADLTDFAFSEHLLVFLPLSTSVDIVSVMQDLSCLLCSELFENNILLKLWNKI